MGNTVWWTLNQEALYPLKNKNSQQHKDIEMIVLQMRWQHSADDDGSGKEKIPSTRNTSPLIYSLGLQNFNTKGGNKLTKVMYFPPWDRGHNRI
jgi:hypothetical protein